MKTIHVKVWNEDTKEMTAGMQMPMLAGYLGGIYPNLKNEVFIESTNLYDKHGIEIYEGDIVRVPNIDYDPSNGDDPFKLKKVVYHAGQFGITNEKGGEFEGLCDYWEGIPLLVEIEVVSNIYQDKELLK